MLSPACTLAVLDMNIGVPVFIMSHVKHNYRTSIIISNGWTILYIITTKQKLIHKKVLMFLELRVLCVLQNL